MARIASHTFRNDEAWTVRKRSNTPTLITKRTVRVAKGDPSGRGGQFHGATNLRGTVVAERTAKVSLVKSA